MQPLKTYYHLSPQDAFVVAGCRSTKDACDIYMNLTMCLSLVEASFHYLGGTGFNAVGDFIF